MISAAMVPNKPMHCLSTTSNTGLNFECKDGEPAGNHSNIIYSELYIAVYPHFQEPKEEVCAVYIIT